MGVSTGMTPSHNPRSIFCYLYLINFINTPMEEPSANAYLDHITFTSLVLLRIFTFKIDFCRNSLHITTVSHPMWYDVPSSTLLFVFEALAPPFIETYLWHVWLGRVTARTDRCIFQCRIRYQ